MPVLCPTSISVLLLVTLGLAPQSIAGPGAPVDFTRDIKPILSDTCYHCHGPDAGSRKSGLRLDRQADALAGGKSGLAAIVPGQPDASELIARIFSSDPDEIMPAPDSHRTLTANQKELLRRWIAEGAGWKEHWAYVPPTRPSLPAQAAATDRAPAPAHPIDAFIHARLAEARITPSPEAPRRVLLRRLALDLTGLPPTPAEVDAFERDPRPDAYERQVDRLLASPHHGERWARPWLDVARYADSNGYSVDAPRQIWKYRDWVVAALNRDLPYDQFVIEQLAGDLLPNATVDQKVATGFNRNTQINQEGGIDPEQFRIESVMDRVATFGSAFLGLTLACSQCHDHKFDPLPQRDYYRLFAFFNSTVDDGHGKSTPGATLAFEGEVSGTEAAKAAADEARLDLEAFLDARGGDFARWRVEIHPDARAQLSPALRAALDIPWAQQTLAQRRSVYGYFVRDHADFQQRVEKLNALERLEGKAVTTLVMSELPEPRATTVFVKGDFTRPGDPVSPGTPAILPPLAAEKPTRLDLARWLFQPDQPLTARVMVNRIWQVYFGRGLVETENDFGSQGSAPSHPELLDWLATEFAAGGWSMKALHRLIVTSATYRQQSLARPDLELSDPLNHLLSRQTRLRLDAELVRDVALVASGLLAPRLGGPPVFPPQPDGVMNLGQSRRAWIPSTGDDRHRRGLYTHFWRATPHPAAAVFDAPDAFSACTRRIRSNTPLQALTLLNDQQFIEFAEALAARVLQEGGNDDTGRLDLAFRLCLSRPPTATERSRLLELLRQIQSPQNGEPAGSAREAWIAVARVLLNLDETITRA
ncbi:MAG: PSD1 domain-containing protein [Opitutaceae bacterium]|nr:PSD1 domain-containing protein [Opitutaceae bacterium]